MAGETRHSRILEILQHIIIMYANLSIWSQNIVLSLFWFGRTATVPYILAPQIEPQFPALSSWSSAGTSAIEDALSISEVTYGNSVKNTISASVPLIAVFSLASLPYSRSLHEVVLEELYSESILASTYLPGVGSSLLYSELGRQGVSLSFEGDVMLVAMPQLKSV